MKQIFFLQYVEKYPIYLTKSFKQFAESNVTKVNLILFKTIKTYYPLSYIKKCQANTTCMIKIISQL